jgi:type III restriction enzyme
LSWIEKDAGLLDDISSRFDLRKPNEQALREIIDHVHGDVFKEVVCDMATGVGKTYISAAFIEYLASQGKRNILIVTPGKTIQEKTINNFTQGHPKYITGGYFRPVLITAENFKRGGIGDVLHDPNVLKLFIFNVQQLTRPSEANSGKKTHELNEFIGSTLYEYLQNADDLTVIADEHHVYNGKAKVFSSTIRELGPRAMVGLTATPDATDEDKVIYRYSLAAAIADQLVKVPVIAYRKDGQKDERTQLADACHLLRVKEAAYASYTESQDQDPVHPVLFVVCQTIEDAERVSLILADDGFIGDGSAVLQITGGSSDEALKKLASVEEPGSKIRAVVSVDKLKEGWDVRNIAVIVALRRLASDTLTEQILGRGLRLPFGRRVGIPMVDQVDVVAHDSYKSLLSQKNALIQRAIPTVSSLEDAEALDRTTSVVSQEFDKAVASVGEQGQLRLVSPAQIIEGREQGAATTLVLNPLDDGFFRAAEAEAAVQQPLAKRVTGAPQIIFPRRDRDLLRTSFTMDYVTAEGCP